MGSEDQRIRIAIDEARAAGVLRGGVLNVAVGAEARDDCAVLELTPDTDLVIGTDFVRGTGFFLFAEGVLSYEDVGWYLVAANVSDIAAMGARPAGIVVATRYAKDLTDEQWRSVMKGICAACHEFDVPLLGGDSGGYSENVLSAAAIGTVPHGAALLRSAGRAADRVFVTGSVGTAGAAVAYFYRGRHRGVVLPEPIEQSLLEAWRRVRPAVLQGAWLARSGLCRCALDTSDGLKAGLLELAVRSNVDVVVNMDDVPMDLALIAVADAMALDPIELALSDSVDFRLLFTVADEHVGSVTAEFLHQGWTLHEIGFLREAAGEPKVVSRGESNRGDNVPGVTWEQGEVASVDRLHPRHGRPSR